MINFVWSVHEGRTMSKIDEYRTVLEEITNWDDFLLENSGLPGHRANIELARAAALEGDRELFERYLTYTPERAPLILSMNSYPSAVC
jgi:hypothetical protein